MKDWNILRQECPRLYKEYIRFECGDGWFDILRTLSVKIENLLERDEGKYDSPVEMFAIQVKEKYGTLRFYMSCGTDEIDELIKETEALSTQTCEVCGMPAKMRGVRWFEVRCDKCYKEE